jgi:hypothetical protein
MRCNSSATPLLLMYTDAVYDDGAALVLVMGKRVLLM